MPIKLFWSLIIFIHCLNLICESNIYYRYNTFYDMIIDETKQQHPSKLNCVSLFTTCPVCREYIVDSWFTHSSVCLWICGVILVHLSVSMTVGGSVTWKIRRIDRYDEPVKCSRSTPFIGMIWQWPWLIFKTLKQVQTQSRMACQRANVQGTEFSIALVH